MTALVAFAVVAACLLASGVMVVRATNLVHGVLWLGVTLAATAALYAMLGASFLAGVQVMLYVGGVVTLMVFGVMLTRRHDGIAAPAQGSSPGRALFVCASLFGILAAAIVRTDLPTGTRAVTVAELGLAVVDTHVLAFEALSLVLLAAIIGAAVIARRRDPGATPGGTP
jgi:NADH-quinone oxidoreductase subunit J